ncbi:hypothetical protein [Alkalicoccobacillus porphyridii]|uniref:Uncharacterized protein n=1 Tax=Alkalicoccobacillus porphyridii TaxID=2597270 RepID=A0A554A185_9BACI|nr:hypothetical protein [Alkalicoccobacillus porphyridii]TSB47451.1 hypothetical protein FN960_06870 [Alkalicoccobacillus porphyridii]
MKYVISAILLLIPLSFVDFSPLKVEAQGIITGYSSSPQTEENGEAIKSQAPKQYFQQSRLYNSEAEIPSRIYFSDRGYGGYLGKVSHEKLVDNIYKADFAGYLPPICVDSACPTLIQK